MPRRSRRRCALMISWRDFLSWFRPSRASPLFEGMNLRLERQRWRHHMSTRRADDLGTVESTVPVLLSATPICQTHVNVVLLPMLREHYALDTIAGSFFARRVFVTPSVPATPHTLPRRWNTRVGHSPPPLGIAGLRTRGADHLSGLALGLAVSTMCAPIPSMPLPTT